MNDLNTTQKAAADPSTEGTYCPRCGVTVPFSMSRCQGCGHEIYHHPSKVQRTGLLSALACIIMAGVIIFLQPNPLGIIPPRFVQDVMECGVILCVTGAGVGFFTAVADMVRRGGE